MNVAETSADCELSIDELDQISGGGPVDYLIEGYADAVFVAKVTLLVSTNLLNMAKDPWG
jgi:bacteriocin-like protein